MRNRSKTKCLTMFFFTVAGMIGLFAIETSAATISWSDAALVENRAGAATTPQIAVDKSGNIMAVWAQPDSIFQNIYANLYVPGTGWGAATLIESSDMPADDPQIAVDSSGNFMAVWRQAWKTVNGARYGVYSNRYVAGAGWGAASLVFVITDNEDITASADIQIACDPNGNAVAVWSVYDWSWNHTSVRANRYAVGTGWAGVTNLSTEAVQAAYGASVAMDANGNAAVVWSQNLGTSALQGVHAIMYEAGTGWGAPERIESATEAATRSGSGCQIAFDADGNVIAVWYQYSKPGIYSNRYSLASGWGTPIGIVDTGATSYDEGVRLSIDNNGNAVAVWNQYGGKLYANRYVAGTGWGTTGVVESNGADYSENVAFDQNGNAMAIWGNSSCNSYNIQAARYMIGTGWDPVARCYEASPFVNKTPDNASDPHLVIDIHGNATVVWVQGGNLYSAVAGMAVSAKPQQGLPRDVSMAGLFNVSVRNGTVHYSIPGNSYVSLVVYDTRGATVMTLVNQRQTAGTHTLALPRHELRKGQYLVRCKVDNSVVVRRFVAVE
jgi:hypothetical protein